MYPIAKYVMATTTSSPNALSRAYIVKPKIYSGLKLTKFREFTPQEVGLR